MEVFVSETKVPVKLVRYLSVLNFLQFIWFGSECLKHTLCKNICKHNISIWFWCFERLSWIKNDTFKTISSNWLYFPNVPIPRDEFVFHQSRCKQYPLQFFREYYDSTQCMKREISKCSFDFSKSNWIFDEKLNPFCDKTQFKMLGSR